MLAESIDRWNREIREEGREEGRREAREEAFQEGLQEGEAFMVLRLLHVKFGLLDPEIEDRVRSADSERLLEWAGRILTAGSLLEVLRD